MGRRKKSKQIRQILGNGRERILTIENGQVVSKKTVRRKKSINIFDPTTKVDLFE
ncbi:MAG: hypothetical protein GTN97_03345 [Nitrosopumilaceae archaeon]|nr:hypothetical protein [Nitrosopumilaceae archaeon]